MAIIHISFDYPDSINTIKTKAVFNLIETQTKIPNIIFSLNRTSNPFADYSIKKNNNVYSFNIFGLPYGIGLSLWMYFTSKKIQKIINSDKVNVTIIHAHKLTFEGLVAYFLIKTKRVPLFVSVRGHTDLKVLKVKKIFTRKYSKIVDLSSKIIFISPWTVSELKKIFPNKNLTEKTTLVPNIIELNELPRLETEKEKFVSVFNLDQYPYKNIRRVLLAFNELNKEYPALKLDIIGRGKESSIKRIKKYINNCTYPQNFSLLGPKPHEELLKLYGRYKGLILPSYPETFGMVFIEALNSGIPILYAKNSGIDGFFQDFKLGEKVHYKSVQEIKEAIKKIYLHNKEYLESIAELKEKNELNIFKRDNVSIKYSILISEILKDR